MTLTKGYTYLEVMIALALLGVILTFSLPSITPLFQKTSAKQVAFQLYHDLQLARSEAIQRQTSVTICPLDDHHQCTDHWQKQYGLWAKHSDHWELIKVATLPSNNLQLKASLGHPSLTFLATGFCTAQGTFWIQHQTTQSKLIFLRSGRLRLEALDG